MPSASPLLQNHAGLIVWFQVSYLLLADISSGSFFCQYLSVFISSFSTQDNAPHSTLDLPAFERSPAAAGELILGFDFMLCIFVHFDPGLGLFGEVEYFSWVDYTFL